MSTKIATIPEGQLNVERARVLLAEAKRVDEVKDIRDKATALLTYARAKGAASDNVAFATEILMRADRRLGELTLELPKASKAEAQAIREEKRTGASNAALPAPTKQAALESVGVSKMQANRAERLAKMPDGDFEALVSEKTKKAHVAYNSGEQEWYTPPAIVDVARSAMGGIDLDPASCTKANQTVKAKGFYSKENNGLEQMWAGRVWLNPPYASSLIGKFADKVVASVDDIEAACILVNNATDTAWCQKLLAVASAVCLISGRVKFLDKTREPTGAPLQGQILIYVGDDVKKFCSEASVLGTCCEVIK